MLSLKWSESKSGTVRAQRPCNYTFMVKIMSQDFYLYFMVKVENFRKNTNLSLPGFPPVQSYYEKADAYISHICLDLSTAKQGPYISVFQLFCVKMWLFHVLFVSFWYNGLYRIFQDTNNRHSISNIFALWNLGNSSFSFVTEKLTLIF